MTWTRRRFVGTSILGLAAGTLPGTLLGATKGARLPVAGPASTFVPLRRNVGIYTARGGTIGWLADGRGTAVVDSQYPDTAESCIAGLRERGASSIDVLINTHHHGDHTGGNPVFRTAGSRIVAQENVPALQRRATATSNAVQAYPDTVFESNWSTVVGDEMVRARHHGPAHTGGDCVVHFENADIVHMGDLVFNRAYPFVDRAGGASMQGWVGVLEAVAAAHTAETIFIFGHALPAFEVTGGRDDVLLQRDFLNAVLETVQSAIAAGASRDEATALETLPGFDEHGALVERLSLAAVLGVAWDELTAD
ncbi:MAG TPA: MBL fold metallo-hydrolase [Longimicrobiales bacterium]|nr:MBL fold metallo-hydrolase [Longimicrobiales bacterium]